MYVRKINRICGVKKCSNKQCYHISRSREVGNSVIICEDCLKEALAEIERMKQLDAPKAEVDAHHDDGAKTNIITSDNVNLDVKPIPDTPENLTICRKCGRRFTTARGLKMHKCGDDR